MRSSTVRLTAAAVRHWPLLRRRDGDGAALAPRDMAPCQAAEIEAALAAVGPAGPEMALRLQRQLCPLVRRGVPPRAIRAAPVPQVARLVFADATTVLVKSTVPGGFGLLAFAMTRGSVRTAACGTDTWGRTCLELSLPGRSRGLTFYVTGLDQPD